MIHGNLLLQRHILLRDLIQAGAQRLDANIGVVQIPLQHLILQVDVIQLQLAVAGQQQLPLPELLVLLLQQHHLLPQLGDQLRLRVLVGHHLVLDVLRSIRVAQRIERLHKVPVAGGDAGDHRRDAVPAQTVLQHPRQLRVAVGNVRGLLRAVAQRRDDVPEVEQARVDGDALAGALSHRSGAGQPLRARQVDKVELGGERDELLFGAAVFRSIIFRHLDALHATLLDEEGEDGVRTRRLGVHQRRAGGSKKGAVFEAGERLLRRRHRLVLHPGEDDAPLQVLLNSNAVGAAAALF